MMKSASPSPVSNYSAATGRFVNLRPNRPLGMGPFGMLAVIAKLLLDAQSRAPRSPIPQVTPDLAAFLAPGATARLIWFGHSTLLLNIAGQIILIDPVFSIAAAPFDWMTRRFQPAALPLAKFPPVDVVVLSHDHYDHLDKRTIRFFANTTTEFVVPLGLGAHLRQWGIAAHRIHELNWYESHTHRDVTYTATPAHHSSGRGFRDRDKTLWASWVVRGANERIYYSGDSAYGDHFAEINRRFGPFDAAFIENGQYDTRWPDSHMQPEETAQAMSDITARLYVPVHWGMFDIALHEWSEPIRRLSALARVRGLPLVTPKLGQLVDIGAYTPCPPWWEGV